MRSPSAHPARPILLGLAALLMLTLGQATARADEVTLSGSTTGTVIGVPQLTFAGNAFTGTTVFNVGALSGENRLGTFSLGLSDPAVPVSGSFTLTIAFTSPAGIAGGQNGFATATLTGSVGTAPGQGGVFVINFGPPQTFTFSNSGGTGSFTLFLDTIFVQSGRTAELTAGFTGSQVTNNAPVPEPATLILLGTGVAGIAARLRRRGKAVR